MKNTGKIGIGPFSQLLSMRHLPVKGPLKDEQLGIINNAGLIIESGRVVEVNDFQQIRSFCQKENIPLEIIDQAAVCVPAFIDAHTHICFGGTRAGDYAKRVGGKSYLEIAREGGGIWDTVQKTRKASQEELEQGIQKRVASLTKLGIATIEIKSGYGLSAEAELKMLRAIRHVNQHTEIDLISTCLPAHIVPKDFSGSSREYIDYLLNDFFPTVQKNGLSNRADIFVEDTAFDIPEAKFYLAELKKRGFELTIHADQFGVGGSQLGVEFGARSVDHLEASGQKEIELLAQSDVIPVALPGASMGLGEPFAPARQLLDAGASLAIASDWNPGSAPMGNLLVQAAVLGAYEKLSIAETLAGITFRAAAALGLNQQGKLEKGHLADIAVFPTSDYREIFYRQGQLLPCTLWKKGKRIF